MEFLATLAPIVEAGAPYIILVGAVFTRVSAVVFLAPGLGERAIPMRVRLGAAFAISMVLIPMTLSPEMTAPDTVAGIAALFGAEFMSGIIIGFALRLMVFILQIAGAIIAQSTSLSQQFGPTVGFDAESPFAALLVMAGVAMAAASGLHIHLVGALADAYEVLPFGLFPGAEETGRWSADRVGEAWFKALALSSPFVILGFLYSLALAAASRAMPQLMAAFVGAPAVTLAALALFAAAAPIILFDWLASFQRVLFDIFAGAL